MMDGPDETYVPLITDERVTRGRQAQLLARDAWNQHITELIRQLDEKWARKTPEERRRQNEMMEEYR